MAKTPKIPKPSLWSKVAASSAVAKIGTILGQWKFGGGN